MRMAREKGKWNRNGSAEMEKLRMEATVVKRDIKRTFFTNAN